VGPGTSQERLIEALRAGDVRVPCDGRAYQSLVCVDDVARAFAAALATPCAGMIFNITAPPLRQGEYLNALAEAVNAPRPERDPSLPCPPSWRCDPSAAKALLGWEAQDAVIPI
jgi:nucleoside-diphosphate-sugar epimerase